MSDGRHKKVVRRRTSGCGDDAPESKRRRSHPPATVPSVLDPVQSAGGIVRLTVKNFMCHEHLAFDFNSNVNFITGQNGSGKSAVVTAVMAGLGGRATITDRGSAITELIRTNQPSAVISVTLRNAGDQAFKQDTYGDAITVERTIRASGASSYRLLNANGKLVSNKKKDLTDIMDALNIQVENPIAILTQETSKNFLRKDDPKKKYSLFLEATRLAQIRRWYDQANASKRSSENVLTEKKECLGALKSKVDEYERLVNICKNRQGIRQKIKMLEANIQWAKVMEREKALEKATAEHSEKEKEIENFTNKRKQWEEKLASTDEKKTEVQQQKRQLDQQRAQQVQQADQLKKELRDLMDRQQKTGSRLKEARAKSRNQQADRDNLQKEIARLRNETQPDLAAESQRRQDEVTRLAAELEELTAAERTQQGHMQHVTGSLQRARDELQQTQVEERERQRKIGELEGQLRRYRDNQADPRAVFGSWVAAVDREIETCWKQRKFMKKPIGPLGAYVRVRAGCDEWKPLVETCLAGVLRAYLVDDRADIRLMSDILARHTQNERQKPRVVASKFLNQVHDVRQHGIDTLSGAHVSVWSVLDIDHPVVANAVIDQARAESVLLLRTDAEARDTMAYRDRVPAGCAQALTRAGYRYYPDPGYRTYPVNVPRQARYLQVSMEDVIRDLTDQLQECRAEAQAVTDRLGPARTAVGASQRQEREALEKLEQVRRKKQAVQTQLRQIRSQEEPEPINLQALEEEVQSYTQTIDQLETDVAPLVEQKEEMDKKVEECRTSYKRAAEEIQSQFSERLASLNTELETTERHREKIRSALDRSLPQLEAKRSQLDGLQQTVTDCRQQAEQAAAAAAGPRLQPNKSVTDLESRLRGMKRSLERDNDQQQPSWEQVSEQFQHAQLAYQRTQKDVATIDDELDKLKTMLDERNCNYEILKRSLANRVTQFFFTILDARNFGGNMKFDHDTQKLTIEIRPGEQGGGGGGERSARAPLQLSGGERSFSTLAFVLAMWSAMPSPFRMLDEFDVFMDEVNRKIGHDMLLKNALEHNSQFVFITPLAIPGTHNDTRITIHRMHPPKRE